MPRCCKAFIVATVVAAIVAVVTVAAVAAAAAVTAAAVDEDTFDDRDLRVNLVVQAHTDKYKDGSLC